MRRNLLLALASLLAALALLEIALRIFPYEEHQANNEYLYRQRTGEKQFLTPYHSWRERFPPEFDSRGYYRRSGYTVDYSFDQHGARWATPTERPLLGATVLVVGDSFTYGSGVRFEDTWPQRTQESLRAAGFPATLLNFGKSGADAREALKVYRTVGQKIPHTALIYGLNLNDLLEFGASSIIRNRLLDYPLVRRSRLLEFAVKRVNASIIRKLRIRGLTSPAAFETRRFTENLRAIATMRAEAGKRGARFFTALLPTLIDLRAGTFRPVYREILRRLEDMGISCIDLSGTVDGFDEQSLWIIPVDQHPNEIANSLFAQALAGRILAQRQGLAGAETVPVP